MCLSQNGFGGSLGGFGSVGVEEFVGDGSFGFAGRGGDAADVANVYPLRDVVRDFVAGFFALYLAMAAVDDVDSWWAIVWG